jgi:hypothetical protein
MDATFTSRVLPSNWSQAVINTIIMHASRSSQASCRDSVLRFAVALRTSKHGSPEHHQSHEMAQTGEQQRGVRACRCATILARFLLYLVRYVMTVVLLDCGPVLSLL